MMLPSDRAVPAERVDELAGKFGGQQPTSDLLQEMEAAEASAPMGQPRITSLKPEAMSPQDWAEARRYYGSRELAKMTGLSEEEVLRLAPGPSRTPMGVEMEMMDYPEGRLSRYLP